MDRTSYLNGLSHAEPPLTLQAPLLGSLVLDREGFTVNAVYGKTCKWADVSAFEARSVFPKWARIIIGVVGFLLRGGIYFNERRIYFKPSPHSRRRASLPAGYNLSAEELAELLNHWRNRMTGEKK